MNVLKPWIPVKAEKIENGYEISVLDRKYTLDGRSPMFSSIISKGEEMLASPIRFSATNKGKKIEFCQALTYIMNDSNDESCTVISTYQSDVAVINVSHTVEFDGCDDISLTIMPSGRPVGACFGLAAFDPASFDLDSLCMEVPIKKDAVKYFNVYPSGGVVFNNPDEKDNSVPDTHSFSLNGVIPKSGIHAQFQSQIYLNSEDKGIGFFFDSFKKYHLAQTSRFFEVENNDNEILLRIRFFDRTPDYWLDKGPDNRQSRDLYPLQYRFGMQVTPVKQLEKRMFDEYNLHIDCFKKTPGDYDEYMSNPVVEGDSESGFDRIQRLGVKTLYLHEKWNDIQNCPNITSETAKRLRYIIDECHKRNIKVVPYFGYEISTLSPYFKREGDRDFVRDDKKRTTANAKWHWYRYPYQRDVRACLNSEQFLEYFYNGLVELQKEFGFDGFYFDSISSVYQCANPAHGCGWMDDTGFVHYVYQNYAIRKFIKKMYAYASENDLIINLHTNGVYTLSCIGFCTSLWEGETIQAQFLNQTMNRIPEDIMRAMYAARDLGVPMYTLCYSKDGVWEYENGASVALLYGSVPKSNDIGKPLEYMSKLWRVLDDFPLEEAEWLPYYAGNDFVKSGNNDVKVSIYKAKNKILAFCTSISTGFDAEVEISCDYRNITDAFTGDMLSDNGKCKLHFGAFECKILIIR